MTNNDFDIIREKRLLSYEYIRGLVDGEGSFTFSTNNVSFELRPDGTSFEINGEKFNSLLIGKFNFENILATITFATFC